MIPKIIHYCWLSGDPIPAEFKRYMSSWKKKIPDYEFVLWDLNRFDINKSEWVKQAFCAGKYAFAADYIRLWALYNYGGIYLDMDVQVVKRLDDLLGGRSLMGYETAGKRLEAAVIGAEKGAAWVRTCLDYYEGRDFITEDGNGNRRFDTKVLPLVIRETLEEAGYVFKDITDIKDLVTEDEKLLPVLPNTFLSPKSSDDRTIYRTADTYTIHHFAGGWMPLPDRVKNWIGDKFGGRFLKSVMALRRKILKKQV